MIRELNILTSVFYVFLFTCFLRPVHASADNFYIHPYVTGVTLHSVRILWLPLGSEDPGTVLIKDPSGEFEVKSVLAPISNRSELLHVAQPEGLTPSYTYHYTIESNRYKAYGKFITSPKNGDTHSRPDQHQIMSQAIAAEDPMLVLCSGDFVTDGKQWDMWKNEFFDTAKSYLSKSAIWPVRGNHENDGVYYHKLFDRPMTAG